MQNIENFIHGYGLNSTITKQTTIDENLTHFQFVDIVEGVKIWWATVSIIETPEGIKIIPHLLTESIGYSRTLDRLCTDMLKQFGKAEEPVKPEEGSSVFMWLDYREAERKAGRKVTLKMLAKLSGYGEGTFKQESKRWKLQRENN